jgi:hypothetical protein
LLWENELAGKKSRIELNTITRNTIQILRLQFF